MASLFDPLDLGDLVLPNRVLMAPLTRLRAEAPLNPPDFETFYGHGPEGYIDYPALTEPAHA